MGQQIIDFIQTIVIELATIVPNRRLCFVMDNLQSHQNQQMSTIIIVAGHRLMFCAPYYPVNGPIEYVFNTIQGVLRIHNDVIIDDSSLINELRLAITAIPSFEPYFINCGYWCSHHGHT